MNFRITRILSAATIVAASVLSAVFGVSASASAATDTGDVTWTVRTASNELGDDRTSYVYTVDPGAEVSDALVIANRGSEDLTLAVYAADGYTTEAGQFDIDTLDEAGNGIGAWVAAGEGTVTVKAGETATVPFTLTVPGDATPGDYAGGIVTSLAQDGSGAGVSVDRRLGIRMAARVNGDLAPALVVEDPQVSWDGGLNPFAGGDATVTYTIRNTGNTLITGTQSAMITGPFGWFPVEAAVEAPPQLLPGESWQQTVTVPDIASLVLLTASVTVVPTATDASGSTSALAFVTASASGWAVPWMLLILIVLVVLLIIFVPRWSRARAATRQAAEDARVQEAVDRALEDAAEPETAEVTR